MLARAQETTGAGPAEPACAPVSRKADAAIERVPGRRVVGRGPSGAPAGFVYLVGAGPGDAELLTLKAARLLAEADACVYDHLVGAGVLALVRPGAEHIYVGKERSNHALPPWFPVPRPASTPPFAPAPPADSALRQIRCPQSRWGHHAPP